MWLEPRRPLRLLRRHPRWRWGHLWQLHRPSSAAQPLSHVAVAAAASPATAWGASAVTSAASPTTASSATPASAASQAGTQKSATRPARRRPGNSQSERTNCGQKPSSQSQSGPCEARRRGHVRRNDVRVNIRKIVREGFNLPGSFGKVMDGLASVRMVLGRARVVSGRARFQPCRYRANMIAGFSSWGTLLFLPSSRNRIAPQSAGAWNLGSERRLRSNSRITRPAPLPRNLATILLGQLEVDCDLRLNFDGLAVEEIGFVLPLKDGFLGRASQYGITS
jgi:hypothetical protein